MKIWRKEKILKNVLSINNLIIKFSRNIITYRSMPSSYYFSSNSVVFYSRFVKLNKMWRSNVPPHHFIDIQHAHENYTRKITILQKVNRVHILHTAQRS